MNSSRSRPDTFRGLIHPMMSISVAATASLAGVFLFFETLGLDGPRTVLVVAVAMAPVIEAVVGNILYRQRSGIGNRVRELIIYLILVYLAVSLVLPGAFIRRFVPTYRQLLSLIPVTLSWIIAFAFHNRLRGREALLRIIRDKRDDELRRTILDRQHDMALTVRELRRARAMIFGLFIFLSIVAGLGASGLLQAGRVGPRSAGFVILVLYGLSTAVSIGAINGFIEEYAANGEGISVPPRFQRRRFIVAAALILAVLTLSLVLSRDESVLPLEAILDFFRWLGELFEREPGQEEPPVYIPPQRQINPNLELYELLEGFEERIPPLWLRILAQLVQRLLVAAAAAGLAILIFGPLFSRSFREGLKRLKPGEFLKDLFTRIGRRMKIIVRVIRAALRGRRRGSQESTQAQEAEPAVGPAQRFKPSLRKRRQMDRVLSVFVALTRWGAENGVPYSRPEAVREYMRRVAEAFPEHYHDAMTVADLFCEARFSTHLMESVRIRNYIQAARKISKSSG